MIIIRLLGRSIRSHAVSTADILSRLGLVMRAEVGRACEDEAARGRDAAGARIARAFGFALK